MQLYLVRHAHAGQRSRDGRDIFRTLSEAGRDRASELAEILGDRPVDRLLSSPATRCRQTLEPLAAATGIEIEDCEDLWEGSSITAALAAVGIAEARSVVACSHGDVIPAMIDMLNGQGIPITGRGCEPGSIWVVELDGSTWRSARYLSTTERPSASSGFHGRS